MKTLVDQPLERVVEGLERHHFVVLPDFFAMADVTAWYDDAISMYQQGLFRSAKIGKDQSLGLNHQIRSDEIFWLNSEDRVLPRQRYFEFLEQLRLVVNREFQLGVFSAECHYTYYQRGSFYKKHLDQHRNTAARKLSVITYLNKDWQVGDGGELKLYLAEGREEIVEPRAGTLVCFFSAAIPHEVLEVRRERLGLTSWLRARDNPLF